MARRRKARRCKYGKLKSPYRDKNGRMHYCKRKKKSKR